MAEQTRIPTYGRLKRLLLNVFLAGASLGVVAGGLEIAVRWYDRAHMYGTSSMPAPQDPAISCLGSVNDEQVRAFGWQGDGNGLLHVRSANRTLVYELRPSVHLNDVVSTNLSGFRDREFSTSKPEGTFRIIVVGDSVTFGWFVRPEHLYPSILEALLNGEAGAQDRFEVYNMAVGGYNAEQELELIKAKCLQFNPDLIVVQYCVNDDEVGADAGLWRHFTQTWCRSFDFVRLKWMQVRRRFRPESIVKRSYRELADLSAQTRIPIVVALFPCLHDDAKLVEKTDAFVRSIGLPSIFLPKPFEQVGLEYSMEGDMYHPNPFGCRIAAEEVFLYLRRTLTAPRVRWRTDASPDFVPVRNRFRDGMACQDAGDYAGALAAYGDVCRMAPEYASISALALGRAVTKLCQEDRPQEVLELCRSAMAWDPRNAEVQTARGWALERTGDARGAVMAYGHAADLNSYYDTNGRLAFARLTPDVRAQGQWAGLVEAYRTATRLMPDEPDMYEALGYALRANGDVHCAREAFRRAIDLGSIRKEKLNGYLD